MNKEEQVIILEIKNNKVINKIRRDFDPNYKKFKSHLTLVYRFKKNKDKVCFHIENIVKDIRKFDITFKGYGKSLKDYYLYFLVNKNKNKIINLHKRLNSGILKEIKNKRMPYYIPHISLGYFKSAKERKKVLARLPKNLVIKEKVNRVTLLTLDKNRRIKMEKNFKLT